jgi:cell wall-associated NlpC family hydrolase
VESEGVGGHRLAHPDEIFRVNSGRARAAAHRNGPGDLVFFAHNTGDPGSIHHVGMYVGGGAMVEAPYSGARVRIASIGRGDYIGAVRPTG